MNNNPTAPLLPSLPFPPPPLPSFLASEAPELPPRQCLFHIIPAPIEETVSYGGGTAHGPGAILHASQQLEAYDGHSCPCELGIFTHPAATTLKAIETRVQQTLEQNRIPVVIGGEHTVSVGAFRALARRVHPVGIVQFDAHADLRDTYEDSPLSHACVMHRALDLGLPILQLGIRSFSAPEVELQRKFDIPCFTAEQIALQGIPPDLLPSNFPADIYITFDIDALDSMIMPATGTPVPGGLDWWQTHRLLEHIIARRRVIGFDLVEFAPLPPLHAADFTAATLLYKIMGMVARASDAGRKTAP